MKHLILLRHAHSSEKTGGQTDKNRVLSNLGINQALAAGTFLKERNITIDFIISSAAERAKATAELVAERIAFNPEMIVLDDEMYQASVGTMLNLIRTTDNYQNILMVGHNPAISYFSEFLTRLPTGEPGTSGEMSPGELVLLRTDVASWKDLEQGLVEWMEHFVP